MRVVVAILLATMIVLGVVLCFVGALQLGAVVFSVGVVALALQGR